MVDALEADWAAAICQAGIDALVELLPPLENPAGLLKELCARLFGGSVAVAVVAGVLGVSGTLSTVAAGVEDRPAARVPPGERGNELVVAGEELGAILWETNVLRLVSSVLISANRLSVRLFWLSIALGIASFKA